MSISRRQRVLLFFLSASGYTAWLSGLGGQLEAQGLTAIPIVAFRDLPDEGPVHVTVVRDPFAGAPAGHTGVPNLYSDSGPFVPNIMGTVDPLPRAAPVIVRATIVGHNSVAYVASGGTMDIVRVGDILAERRIAKIDLQGITFADGTRLNLPETHRPSPVLRFASPSGILLRLDQLRQLLVPKGTASSSSTAEPQRASLLSPAPMLASPGPAPTVDASGIPVGTNPTPDVSEPTPYPEPYPYPYSPARRL